MKIEQEPDGIATGRLIGLGIACVVVGVLAVVVAWLLLDAGAAAAAPRQTLKLPVLESALFESGGRGVSLRKQQLNELRHYRWVDRDAGVAQIPIERAMELRARQAAR
jgi:hypothetical protein